MSTAATETLPCSGCGEAFPIDLLDAKPAGHPDDPALWSKATLECGACYGPGWAPAIKTDNVGERA